MFVEVNLAVVAAVACHKYIDAVRINGSCNDAVDGITVGGRPNRDG